MSRAEAPLGPIVIARYVSCANSAWSGGQPYDPVQAVGNRPQQSVWRPPEPAAWSGWLPPPHLLSDTGERWLGDRCWDLCARRIVALERIGSTTTPPWDTPRWRPLPWLGRKPANAD